MHFPEDVYSFLMFSRYLCSYIAQLLNDWSITMVNICCFSRSDYKNPLIITHFCSNYLISIIKSITLVNECDLENCAAWDFSHPFDNKDTIFRVEVVSDLAYEFCSCVDISVNYILTKYGHLVQWYGGFFWVVPNYCALSSPKTITGLGAVTLRLFILGFSNYQESLKPTNIWAPSSVIIESLSMGISNY